MTILAVDVGGTNTKYALIDERLNMTDKGKTGTVTDSLENYLKMLVSIYEQFKGRVSGIAFSMPGVIDSGTGYFHTGGWLDSIVHETNLKEELEKHIDVTMSFGNDAKCAANAELGFGALKDVDQAIVYVIGTAIGGALISDHKVIQGFNSSCGEFSYAILDRNNMTMENCLALRGGTTGLASMVKEETGLEEIPDGPAIFARAINGDESYLKALERYGKDLALSIYNLNCIFDPEVVAIGGGVSEQELIFKVIEKGFDEIEKSFGFLLRRPKIIACKYHNDANLIGAYYQFLTENQ
jgi:predicted NBD/HSP70 family sugar kinase